MITAAAILLAAGGLGAATSIQLTPAIPSVPSQGPGEVFFSSTLAFSYDGLDRVVLAGDAAGTASTSVQDLLEILITHPDGTVSAWAHDYTHGCQGSATSVAPVDLAPALEGGTNTVTLTLRGRCGAMIGSTALWLVAAPYANRHRVPQDFTTIQQAIDAAAAGDLVSVGPGTFFESGIDLRGKAITLAGAGAGITTIDGAQQASVFTVQQGETPATVVARITIQGGKADDGGGVWCVQSSPTLLDVELASNEAGRTAGGTFRGGGMYCQGGHPVLAGVVFRNNAAGLPAFLGNKGGRGGGLYVSGGSATVVLCAFLNNRAEGGFIGTGDGGGIYATASHPAILRSMFTGNDALAGLGIFGGDGGGIWISGDPFLLQVFVDGNTADGGAGCEVAGSPWIGNAIFSDNVATGIVGNGGGLKASGGSLTLINATFDGNRITGGVGGGLFCSGGTITNAIVTRNKGGGIWQPSGVLALLYNDVWRNTGGDYGGFASPGPFDISAAPLFADAVADDYHLLPGSPCIDGGDPSVLDADGTRSDIGAYGGPDGVWGIRPVILTPPVSQVVCSGQPVSFSVQVTSPGPVAYQWRKDGAAIPGATTSTYTIAAAAAADAGSYDVRVANGPMAARSDPPATLTVAGWQAYGAGTAGSSGCVPQLAGFPCPTAGGSITLQLTNGLGGAPAVIFLGAGQASIPMLGGTLLVLPPLFPLPVMLGGAPGTPCAGSASLPLAIPANPNLVGLTLDFQGMAVDAGAPAGVSMTAGLDMTIGP